MPKVWPASKTPKTWYLVTWSDEGPPNLITETELRRHGLPEPSRPTGITATAYRIDLAERRLIPVTLVDYREVQFEIEEATPVEPDDSGQVIYRTIDNAAVAETVNAESTHLPPEIFRATDLP